MFGFGKTTKLNKHIEMLEKKLAERQTELIHMRRQHEMYKIMIEKLEAKVEPK